MNPLDDLLVEIDDVSERDERFEVSTIAASLQLLGWDKKAIASAKDQLGDEFNWSWFNGESGLEVTCGSGRDFRFSFDDFFLRPTKHAVVQAALEFSATISPKPWAYIFNVYGQGRMVASNVVFRNLTHIHVAVEQTVNIYKIKDFFSDVKESGC